MITLTREEAQQVLDALEKIIQGCNDVERDGHIHKDGKDLARLVRIDCRAPVEVLRARLAQPEPEREKGDMPCIEDDGCPTEKAVLQRFWRKHRQPEPKPVAFQCCEHGDNEWFITPAEAYGVNPSRYKYRALYTAPPQREWQGLTDEEKSDIDAKSIGIRSVMYLTEAKLKEKNG